MDAALISLSDTSKQFVGMLVMLALMLGIALHALNHILNEKKPEMKKKSLLGKAGSVALAICLLLLVLYLAIPVILPSGQCPPKVPPYCGSDYCTGHHGAAPSGSNCTCLQY